MTARLTFRANGDANSYALLDDTGNWFMSLLVNGQQMEAKQVENLRRLAATWNACDGIPTEALERVEGDTTPVFELLMQTTRERDALRTALNNLLNTVNQYDCGDYYLGTDAEQILAEANRVSIETAEPAPPPDTTITTNSVCGKPGHTCNWVDTQPSGSKCTICGETTPF